MFVAHAIEYVKERDRHSLTLEELKTGDQCHFKQVTIESFKISKFKRVREWHLIYLIQYSKNWKIISYLGHASNIYFRKQVSFRRSLASGGRQMTSRTFCFC